MSCEERRTSMGPNGVCGDASSMRTGHSVTCGYSAYKEQYKIIECIINTYYMNSVPLKVRVNGSFPEGSNLNELVNEIVLETKYNNTFIKVIDVQRHNLNPSITYPMSYLLALTSITSDPHVKRFEHDIIFNIYNFLHFLNKHNIQFNYDNLVVLCNIPELDNAFWNGSYLSFGNGTAGHTALTSSMIIAHELTHALIGLTCNLEYEGQSGALNESFADCFGVSFEFYMKETFPSLGFELGTECGLLLRNMKDPHKCQQPEIMYDQYYMDPHSYHDNGGVHINSGIPNKVFYLVQEKIGYKKALELWIRCIYKLKKYSTFIEFKNTIQEVNQFLLVINNKVLKDILDKHIF